MEVISDDGIVLAIETGYSTAEYKKNEFNISKYLKEPGDKVRDLIASATSGKDVGLTAVLAKKLVNDFQGVVYASIIASKMYEFGLGAGDEQIIVVSELKRKLSRKASMDLSPNTYLENSEKIVQLLAPFAGEDDEASRFDEDAHVFTRIKRDGWITIDPKKMQKEDVIRCFKEISALN